MHKSFFFYPSLNILKIKTFQIIVADDYDALILAQQGAKLNSWTTFIYIKQIIYGQTGTPIMHFVHFVQRVHKKCTCLKTNLQSLAMIQYTQDTRKI